MSTETELKTILQNSDRRWLMGAEGRSGNERWFFWLANGLPDGAKAGDRERKAAWRGGREDVIPTSMGDDSWGC